MPTSIHDYSSAENIVISVDSASAVVAQLPAVEFTATPGALPRADKTGYLDYNWFDTPVFNIAKFLNSQFISTGAPRYLYDMTEQPAAGSDQVLLTVDTNGSYHFVVTNQKRLALFLLRPKTLSITGIPPRAFEFNLVLYANKNLERITDVADSPFTVDKGAADWLAYLDESTGETLYGKLKAGTFCLLRFMWVDATKHGGSARWHCVQALGPFFQNAGDTLGTGGTDTPVDEGMLAGESKEFRLLVTSSNPAKTEIGGFSLISNTGVNQWDRQVTTCLLPAGMEWHTQQPAIAIPRSDTAGTLTFEFRASVPVDTAALDFYTVTSGKTLQVCTPGDLPITLTLALLRRVQDGSWAPLCTHTGVVWNYAETRKLYLSGAVESVTPGVFGYDTATLLGGAIFDSDTLLRTAGAEWVDHSDRFARCRGKRTQTKGRYWAELHVTDLTPNSQHFAGSSKSVSLAIGEDFGGYTGAGFEVGFLQPVNEEDYPCTKVHIRLKRGAQSGGTVNDNLLGWQVLLPAPFDLKTGLCKLCLVVDFTTGTNLVARAGFGVSDGTPTWWNHGGAVWGADFKYTLSGVVAMAGSWHVGVITKNLECDAVLATGESAATFGYPSGCNPWAIPAG